MAPGVARAAPADPPSSAVQSSAVRGPSAPSPATAERRVVTYPAARTTPAVPATPRIVGGAPIAVASAPYQVRIRARKDGQPWGTPGAFSYGSCGGAVIDPTRIVTAAHCVTDGLTAVPPASFRVDSGFSRFNGASGSGGAPQAQPGDTPQARGVAAVRRHPYYRLKAGSSGTLEDLADDVAVLTLDAPLTFDANTQPVPLADPGESPIGLGRVTGFGLQADGGAADGGLYALAVPLIDAAANQSDGGAAGLNALYVVSLSPAGSTCQGDSGGPLVTGGRLVGVVSSGPACGGGSRSNYANVAAGEIREFVLGNDLPPRAPRGGRDMAMRGPASPRVGDVLACAAGTWSEAPAFAYAFFDVRNGRLLQAGPGTGYRLQAADAGARVACRATAATPGGVGRTPLSGVAPAVAAAPKARLQASVGAASRVRRGGRLRVVLKVRVRSGGPAASVRACVRPGAGFSVVRRGGGTLTGGRLCWTSSSIVRASTRRFHLQASRRVRAGRRTALTVSVTGANAVRTSARARVTVRR